MLNWKKKLGSLVPGEARAHLQNALTVEWSGHKTVLVEVPQTRENDDVELSGIGGEGGQYGRLVDDDDDEHEEQKDFVRPRLGRGRSATASGSAEGYAAQSAAHARSESTPTYPGSSRPYIDPDSVFARPPNSARARAEGPSGVERAERRPNPFANPFSHEDDYAAAAGLLPTPPTRGSPLQKPSRPPRPQINSNDIWNNLGAHRSPTSPTSSGFSSPPTSAAIARPRATNDPFSADRRL